MSENWEILSDSLADQIGRELAVEVQQHRLSEKLLTLDIRPPNAHAASIAIAVSPSEVIVSAGRGTRFELGPLPGAEGETLRLVRAISKGNLTEEIHGSSVTFKLRVDGRTILRGRSQWMLAQDDAFGPIEYAPYMPRS